MFYTTHSECSVHFHDKLQADTPHVSKIIDTIYTMYVDLPNPAYPFSQAKSASTGLYFY